MTNFKTKKIVKRVNFFNNVDIPLLHYKHAMQKEKIKLGVNYKGRPDTPLVLTIKFSIVVAAIGIIFCIILLTKNGF